MSDVESSRATTTFCAIVTDSTTTRKPPFTSTPRAVRRRSSARGKLNRVDATALSLTLE